MNSFLICCVKLQHLKRLKQGVHPSWKWWTWPGIFFCPGIYYFQSFVLECLGFFLCSSPFFFHSHYSCILPQGILSCIFSACAFWPCPILLEICLFFRKIINMAKHNCTSNDDWLIEFEWVEKFSIAWTACCKLCHYTLDIFNMGRSAVTSHSKGKKHKDE